MKAHAWLYLEALDELDNSCNPQQSQQLLYAQKLTDLHACQIHLIEL